MAVLGPEVFSLLTLLFFFKRTFAHFSLFSNLVERVWLINPGGGPVKRYFEKAKSVDDFGEGPEEALVVKLEHVQHEGLPYYGLADSTLFLGWSSFVWIVVLLVTWAAIGAHRHFVVCLTFLYILLHTLSGIGILSLKKNSNSVTVIGSIVPVFAATAFIVWTSLYAENWRVYVDSTFYAALDELVVRWSNLLHSAGAVRWWVVDGQLRLAEWGVPCLCALFALVIWEGVNREVALLDLYGNDERRDHDFLKQRLLDVSPNRLFTVASIALPLISPLLWLRPLSSEPFLQLGIPGGILTFRVMRHLMVYSMVGLKLLHLAPLLQAYYLNPLSLIMDHKARDQLERKAPPPPKAKGKPQPSDIVNERSTAYFAQLAQKAMMSSYLVSAQLLSPIICILLLANLTAAVSIFPHFLASKAVAPMSRMAREDAGSLGGSALIGRFGAVVGKECNAFWEDEGNGCPAPSPIAAVLCDKSDVSSFHFSSPLPPPAHTPHPRVLPAALRKFFERGKKASDVASPNLTPQWVRQLTAEFADLYPSNFFATFADAALFGFVAIYGVFFLYHSCKQRIIRLIS